MAYLVGPFKEAALVRQPGFDKDKRNSTFVRDKENEQDMKMSALVQQANHFQSMKRGNDYMRAGHYLKIMMGILHSGLDFIMKENQRIDSMLTAHGLDERQLSERQEQKFTHYLHILSLFNIVIKKPKISRKKTSWCRMLKEFGIKAVNYADCECITSMIEGVQ